MTVASELSTERPRADGPRMSELLTSHESVLTDAVVAHVAARFRDEASLEALGVVDAEGRAVGLLDRAKLLLKLSHQFGYALYGRAPVTRILEDHALIVLGDESLETVLGRVLERPESDVYDAILVTDEAGRFLGIVSVKQLVLHQTSALANVTLERHLVTRRAEELEKINALKSSFIAHVTHELRAPVNAIISMVELLTRASRDGNVGKMGEMLQLLTSSVTSLRALVTNVLDLSKLEAGRMDVFVEEFDLAVMVREIAAMARVLIGQKPVTVEVMAHDGPITLWSDSVKVKQVLTNIASNAAKFTDRGQVCFSFAERSGRIAIVVRDTGIGISPEQLERVFEPFVQVEDVHTRRHDGTGLGLSITRRLLELLGGDLEVESNLGQGSSFTVLLPHLKESPFHAEAHSDHR